MATGTVRSTVAELKTLKARIDGNYADVEVNMTFKAGSPEYITIDHDGYATAGVGENITIEISDLYENTVDNFSGIIQIYTNSTEPADMITWGIGGGAGSIIGESRDTLSYQYSTSDNGIVSLVMTDNRAETIELTAEYGAVVSQPSQQLVIAHGSADRIFVISGNGQRAVVDNPVPLPLIVGVEDQWENRVSGETVSFAVVSGGGEIDTDTSTGGLQSSSVTGSQGTAVCDRWVLGTTSGTDSDEASAGISSGSVTTAYFTATTDHDELASVVITPLSGDVTVNSSSIVTAVLKDQFDNFVTGENITIYIKDTPDGGLSEDLSNSNPTDALGPAIRSGTSDSTGTITVVYDAPSGAGVSDILDADHAVISAENIDDVIYTTVASGATKLLVTNINPPAAEAGETFSFTVRAVDSNDNLDPSNSSHIVLLPESGGGLIFSLSDFGAEIIEADLTNGSVTIYGRGTRTGAWRIDLTASSPVLTAAYFDIGITANHNVDYYLFASPADVTAGSDFEIQLRAKDRYGNLVTSASYDIDLRAVQPSDTTSAASGLLSVTSGSIVNGIFSEKGISYEIAEQIGIEVSDAISSIVGVTDPINVGHAPAYQIVETGGDSTGVAAGDSITLRAEVLDQYGNMVIGESVSFSLLAGGGGLAATQRFTRADGTTSVRYRTGTTAGLNTVRAAILNGNPEGLETQVFEISTVPVSTVSYLTLDIAGSSFTAGVPFACEVAAYDIYDNLIITDNSSQLIPVAESASIDFIPDTLTLTSGEAVFTASDTVMGTNRIAVESLSGVTLAPFSPLFTVSAADAYLISEIAGDTTGVISGDTAELRVRVRDAYGNPVDKEIVHFTITSDLGGSPSLDDDTGASDDGLVITGVDGSAVCRVITDSNAGSNIITATILDGEPVIREKVEFSVVTTAGNISRYVITTADYSHSAGEHFTADIVAYDLNDNIAYGDFTTVVQLGSSGSAVWDTNPVTLSNGSATVGVSETLAGNLILTAETDGGGALSNSDIIVISPELPSGTINIFSAIPDTITADGSSKSSITTGAVRDLYGNIVTQRTRITVSPSSGSVVSDDLDPIEPGFQRETTASGIVSVFIESSTTPGNSVIEFTSVEGSAYGDTTLVFAPPPACSYGGYIFPVIIVPGEDASFRILVTNSSATGLYLDPTSSISFKDGTGNNYLAALGTSVFLGGGESDTLDFNTVAVPSGFLGGTYTPQIDLEGSDIYGSGYNVDFDAGTNSVTVSSLEISRLTAHKTVLSRGDTVGVDVSVRNSGGDLAVIEDIQLDFSHGNYSVINGPVPSLPDTIFTGLEKTYTINIFVLPNCPVGLDSIDASVHATAEGKDFYDYSADDGVITWLIQSAATIAYQSGSLDPAVVSAGQTQQFSISLENIGEAPVILDASATTISFSDGVLVFDAELSDEAALPGEAFANVKFLPTEIPPAMVPGNYPLTLTLSGSENGAMFDTSFVLSDMVEVTGPAQLEYITSTILPVTVSKNSSVSFETGIRNTGGAGVICDPENSYIAFNDGTVSYYAILDEDREVNVNAGENTLYFESVTVPAGLLTGTYNSLVHLEGTENGLPFSVDIPVTDEISVQEPSQLSINSIEILPTDRMTADQINPLTGRIKVENNGEASVRLDSMSIRMFVGSNPVAGQYIIVPVDFAPGLEFLSGGQVDTFDVTIGDEPSNLMTTGTVVVEASVYGTDLNSTEDLVATTEYGGKGTFLVQTAAEPSISDIVVSVDRATVLQTRDWTVDVVVRNNGESDFDIDLAPAATFLTFSTSGDFTVIYPTQLNGGGTVLEGESSDTLSFVIDQTGSVSGSCEVDAAFSGQEINSLRDIGPLFSSPGIPVFVEVQEPGLLSVAGIVPTQDPVTIGQENEWHIELSVLNSGGSSVTVDPGDHDSTLVEIPDGTGFSFEYPDQFVEGGLILPAGATRTLRYTVSTTGDILPGRRLLAGGVVGIEDNSGNSVYAYSASTGDSVTFQSTPDPNYMSGSLNPVTVSSGTDVTLEMTVSSSNSDHSTLILERDKTYAWFGDSDGDTLRTWLSGISANQLIGGESAALRFNSVTIDTGLSRESYTVGMHLEGTENGNTFSTDLASTPDLLTVEEAPQLSIISLETPQSVTRSLQPPWEVRMVLHNTGEASVEIDLDNTGISFEIAGKGDRTGEYTIVPPTELQEAGNLILAGNQVDSLVFRIDLTGSTTGTALVNGTVTATDINSSEIISDDTYTGGGSYILIQEPALPVVVESIVSRGTLTSGQSTPWFVTVLVENQGEAVFDLDIDSTYIFSDYPLTVPAGPVEFVEGGTSLAENESGHLIFTITPTPVIPSGYDLDIDINLGVFENNRNQYLYYNTEESSAGGSSVRIQSPADIHIVSVVNGSHRAPYVNHGQLFPVFVVMENTGEAAAEEINLTLSSSSGSVILNSPVLTGLLAGSHSVTDTFFVAAAGVSIVEVLDAAIQSAVDANSGQGDLVILSPADDGSENVNIQLPGTISMISFASSQEEVNAGQTVDWSVRIDFRNDGEAPVEVRAPAASDLEFRMNTILLSDYLVIPPAGFASGASDLILDGGEIDSLIFNVSSTGIDTGIVDIRSQVEYTDENDPELPSSSETTTGTIRVKEPSGLRIISVTSSAPNNSMFPNTSIVNIDQSFQITVVVENTGGDDLEEVEVSLLSNGPASITLYQQEPELASGSQGEFIFDVSSPASGVEILTASIVRAVSVNTGAVIPPIQAVESIENIQVQVPAALHLDLWVSAPEGAEDDTVSTSQTFQITALVTNLGEANVDRSGQITLGLLDGYSSVYAGIDTLTRSFAIDEEVIWTIRAPSSPSSFAPNLSVSISRIPRDMNIEESAGIEKGSADIFIVTEDAADISGCAMQIISPAGAVDGVVSTEQGFSISVSLTPSYNTEDAWVEITPPSGCGIIGSNRVVLGASDGTEKVVTWNILASSFSGTGFEFSIASGGTDSNSGKTFDGCSSSIEITIVEKSELDLDAFISGPPEALEGNMSVNLPFTIEALVTNLGSADVDTSGAWLEIVLPQDSGYRLDGVDETYKKTFYPGVPVEWHLRAPVSATPPKSIVVRFGYPGTDENSGEIIVPLTNGISIPVTTESGKVAMLNISEPGVIPPYVVPQGTRDVPVLEVIYENNSEYTIGLDTIYVSVLDKRDELRDPVSDAVTSVIVRAGGSTYEESSGLMNPVPIIVGHRFTIEPGEEDTMLVSVDIADNAPAGLLKIELGNSSDVVFSIGEEDPIPISVVWGGGTGDDDISGHFECGPLSVMDADFSKYVHNYPNPFRAGSETTKITYFLTRDSSVSIKIYDLMGILVWTKDIPAGEQGSTGSEDGTVWDVEWDGRNGRGALVRNGVYICKIQAGSESAIFKIAVAK
ncbi:MAG: T9SS type A sorting domain-containing protein [Candidatus Krumholzibacteriota bacterium]|nr:T9SS type A sorting domain-containing protein [Candidatus Krumholzibacteriota bacterium]